MTQININPAPVTSMIIRKNTAEFFWLSETVTENTNSLQNKNTKVKKDFKKNK
ncbi:hypothetical protein OIU83_00225 [Flavobacterium sp. LS1R49]|uniref:Uncharacterized protein n=1 Tax=Flavobacterium shii TaxID=2987687 RepID=A0A9X2Z8V3_9FLAO|nr:hypothetical protein [Flavobacterium shii]MCV9926064.1 hypothetical protein [Flavobacterium shii]